VIFTLRVKLKPKYWGFYGGINFTAGIGSTSSVQDAARLVMQGFATAIDPEAEKIILEEIARQQDATKNRRSI
jgi:hypothetical protein